MKIVVNGVLTARHGLILRQRGATAFPDPLEAFPDPKSINFGPMLVQNVGFAGLPGLRGRKVKKSSLTDGAGHRTRKQQHLKGSELANTFLKTNLSMEGLKKLIF